MTICCKAFKFIVLIIYNKLHSQILDFVLNTPGLC